MLNYCQYKILRAPASTEGIRRKRKLLVQKKNAKTGLGHMEFKILTKGQAKLITEAMFE